MSSSKTEVNKNLVKEFIQKVFVEKNYDDETLAKYVAENVIEHNPEAPDGRDAMKGLEQVLTDFVLVKIIADEDMVWTLNRFTFAGKKSAAADVFRIEDGKIAEHWDVIQEMPKPGESKNDHPMF